MTPEQGVLTVVGELRSIVSDLQAENKELKAKLESLADDYQRFRNQHASATVVDFDRAEKS
jgi:hypothetical protein